MILRFTTGTRFLSVDFSTRAYNYEWDRTKYYIAVFPDDLQRIRDGIRAKGFTLAEDLGTLHTEGEELVLPFPQTQEEEEIIKC